MAHMISSQSRLDVIRAAGCFALSGNDELLKEFEAIFEQSVKRLRVRNQYAHGKYVVNDKDELCLMRRRFEAGHSRNKQVIHFSGLKQEMVHSLNLVRRLHDFLVRLESQIPEELKQAWKQIHALRFPLRRTSPE